MVSCPALVFYCFGNLTIFAFLSTAKPGRVVGSVVPCDNGRSVKDAYEARTFYRNAILPPQSVSPHCFFRANTMMQDKSVSESEKRASQMQQQPSPYNLAGKPTSAMAIDMNANPYYQPQSKVDQLNERMAIDAKLLQAQSQFGAAAVAVAAHRNVGTVHYGMS